jgi:NAD-dependent dihydropyrimidine dehydrogenase PreA subunit
MFVELMAHQAGVRTISIGGRPVVGPMQTASGTRGAREYTSDALDFDSKQLNDTLRDEGAYSQSPARDDTGMWIDFASFNIRDQMRKDGDTPLQFQYNAAQCRIYYTLDNIYNMTRLWRDAASATWEDKSLCVEDSTGYAPEPNSSESKSPPDRKAQTPVLDTDSINKVSLQTNSTGGLDGITFQRNSIPASNLDKFVECDSLRPCKGSFTCQSVVATCPQGGFVWKQDQPSLCLPPCSTSGRRQCDCQTNRRAESKANLPQANRTPSPGAGGRGVTNGADGYCLPAGGQVRGQSFTVSSKACNAGRITGNPGQ